MAFTGGRVLSAAYLNKLDGSDRAKAEAHQSKYSAPVATTSAKPTLGPHAGFDSAIATRSHEESKALMKTAGSSAR
jgi:hypothetical protein